MDSIKVNPVSFKGSYLVKGSPEVLDEICWYLQRKKGYPELGFDFCDFRLKKNPLDKISSAIPSVDLFLTQQEKQIAGNKVRDMLLDTIKGNAKTLDYGHIIKVFSKNIEEIENNISYGKPILSIPFQLIPKYFDFLNLHKMKPLEADDVFNGITKGNFDFIEGRMA